MSELVYFERETQFLFFLKLNIYSLTMLDPYLGYGRNYICILV